VTLAGLLARAALRRPQAPRRIVFVEDIPKTASGKILRRLLREGGSAQPQGGRGAGGDARPRRA
jgi:acyl-coenzyme A synthetase/AMP-(fatty) acid ligase